jgi:hypothetical protein
VSISQIYYNFFFDIFVSFPVEKNFKLLQDRIKSGLDLDADWKLVARFLFWRSGITKLMQFWVKPKITELETYWSIDYGYQRRRRKILKEAKECHQRGSAG